MAIYYIADTHFGHDNIRRLCNRPFVSVEEMDKEIIENWNSRVTDEDDVYILGDFAYKSKDPVEYLNQLNGKKHLITGNHDGQILKNIKFYRRFFEEITPMKTVYDNDKKIVLCHYPLVEWDGYYRGTVHFYGHVHNNIINSTNQYISGVKNAYNVGVDVIGFVPKTAKEILAQ